MAKYVFYCELCWQEFDHINEHSTGSWANGARIDKPCKGKIKQCRDRVKTPSEPAIAGSFDFDASEAINIQ